MKAAGIRMALDRLEYRDVVDKIEDLNKEQFELHRTGPRLIIPSHGEEKKEKKE